MKNGLDLQWWNLHSESVHLLFISHEKCFIQVTPHNVLLSGAVAVLHFDYPQISPSFQREGGLAGSHPDKLCKANNNNYNEKKGKKSAVELELENHKDEEPIVERSGR